ncbi:hypothetical protein [Lysobacter gummosus]|uniref:hypothetical protein n=1 Tax=Lysobacter gummosus TaxID=262324 RepID=UPI0036359671
MTSRTPVSRSSCSGKAVIEIGTSCIASSRFCAVTVRPASVLASSCCGGAAACCACVCEAKAARPNAMAKDKDLRPGERAIIWYSPL